MKRVWWLGPVRFTRSRGWWHIGIYGPSRVRYMSFYFNSSVVDR